MKRALLNCLFVILIFCLTQLIGGIAVAPFYLFDIDTTTVLGAILIIANLLSVFLVWKLLKMIEFQHCFQTINLKLLPSISAVVAGLAGSMVLNILSEQMDLPDLMEEQMLELSNNFFGIIGISLIGPICEELLFREAILGHLRRHGFSPWKAIAVSAFLFGLLHMNPAQIPFAMMMGVFFGFIYCKTGNIVLTCIVHIINNSLSVLEMIWLGDESIDITIQDLLGGIQNTVLFGVVCMALCIAGFWYFNKLQPFVCSTSCQGGEEHEDVSGEV